ncbi:MAG: cobaltochelatase subunit CobN, partial [Oscillospiraceae bacterium]|nr:cobaltochelatase subunit CobN [Oscillospiraceae bacterium]
AADKNSDQTYPYRIAIEDAAEKMPDARAVFDRTEDFDDACRDLRAMLLKADDRRKGNDAHIFGQKPDRQWISDYITEMWTNDPSTAVLFNDIEDPSERADVITNVIDMALSGDRPADAELEYLFEDVKNTACGLLTAGCEMDSLMNALSGGFIRPTPGGDAACGGRAILPPGRNMHEGERGKSPTKAAYERGKKAAAELLRVHMDEGGALPEKIAINMTSLDIVRTGGEQLGQFFALIGMRPVWSPDGRVDGLEVVSLSELSRPRVDVTVHISSIVRDAWPEVLDLMDKAIETVSELDEPEDMNFVKRNSRIIKENGEIATGRIFGKEPGTYTSSVKLALKASAWESDEDLAKYFIDSSSYLFGGDKQGVHAPGTFAANVRQVDATCDITSSRRYDAVASSYSARVQGGFALAAKVLGSKRNFRQYMGESSQSADISVVTMEKHVSDAISDTLLNDVWCEQMMQGGYSGASEFMCRIQNVFEIQCTCNDIADATLDNVVERYVLDERMRKWFADNNPYAIEEAGRRFLELESRGKWNADPEILHKLKLEYLKAEGNLEDGLTGD